MNIINPTALSFPQGVALKEFLNLRHETKLEDLFETSLTEPLKDFLSRPRKNIRNQMVQLGFSIAKRDKPHSLSLAEYELALNTCCAILEIFHSGSLVVDDIQDSSEFRRGRPTLHRIYGVPLALNAGNWLYFLPFQLIEQMPLSPDVRAKLTRECNDTLLRAHYGQALDLGIPVDMLEQERVSEVSKASIELKSGVLAGLAFKMGAICLGASDETVHTLDSSGRRFGVALQMMDDIGCLSSFKNPAKRGEDLKLKRLGHVLGSAAELLPPEEYATLKELMSTPSEKVDAAISFLEQFEVPQKAKARAEEYLSEAIEDLCAQFKLSQEECEYLHSVQKQLGTSYE